MAVLNIEVNLETVAGFTREGTFHEKLQFVLTEAMQNILGYTEEALREKDLSIEAAKSSGAWLFHWGIELGCKPDNLSVSQEIFERVFMNGGRNGN